FLDSSGNRLGIDHVLRHQAFAVGHRQAFLDGALDAHQAYAELVFGHLAHGADAAVTEVIDIIHGTETVANLDQGLDHINDVFTAQYARTFGVFTTQAAIELHATNGAEVVTLQREEQVLEQVLGALLRRRFA